MSRNRKKTAGIILFWIGSVALIFAGLCFLEAWGGGNLSAAMLSYIIAPPSILSVFIGMILFFIGKKEIELQRNHGQSREPRL